MKIDQAAFTKNLVIKKDLINYNINFRSIKTGFFIEIIELDDYKKEKLWPYLYLISKLIYLACDTKIYIAFIIGQLSRYNAEPRNGYLQAVRKVTQYLKKTM